MIPTRTILVATGSRAEFGLLLPVLRAIVAQENLRLRLVVAGAHLASGTWRDIPAAGLTIAARVPMQQRGVVGRAADMAALARGVAGFARVLPRFQPEIALVLGDRIEPLALACAASVGGYRVAHIHGGDRAEGVADEAIRHAISKLAHLHFPATAASRRRLIRMGEPPALIFPVGSPAVDGLATVAPAPDAPEVVVMQHPIGAADDQEQRWMTATLRATAGYRRLIFAPNGDPGAAGIRAALRQAGVPVVEHLPRERFLSLLAGAKAMVGNSSAGLIEAAALRIPAVNIGPRQSGRETPANVIACAYGTAPVAQALARAVRMPRARLRHPYGTGDTGGRIAHILAAIDLRRVPLRKHNTY
jgi:UDP-hydrolysing UDP-N-acetyl-D-glucosamine 2-epimerase